MGDENEFLTDGVYIVLPVIVREVFVTQPLNS